MSQTEQNSPLFRIEGSAGARRHFRYFDAVMAAFVTILLLSNLIGAAKTAENGGHDFGAGILFFPVSYILGDVLTEVYGYAHARRCVWVGFFALLFMAFMSLVVVAMPPKADWGCAASGATHHRPCPGCCSASRRPRPSTNWHANNASTMRCRPTPSIPPLARDCVVAASCWSTMS